VPVQVSALALGALERGSLVPAGWAPERGWSLVPVQVSALALEASRWGAESVPVPVQVSSEFEPVPVRTQGSVWALPVPLSASERASLSEPARAFPALVLVSAASLERVFPEPEPEPVSLSEPAWAFPVLASAPVRVWAHQRGRT
jgi:hypothetical protein